MKADASQYQRIIGAAFVKSAYDQSQTINDVITTDTIVGDPDKFVLRAFNRLAYNRKIGKLLIAGSLLDLSEYYTMPCNVKLINIQLFRNCFYEVVLNAYNQIRDGDNFVLLRQ